MPKSLVYKATHTGLCGYFWGEGTLSSHIQALEVVKDVRKYFVAGMLNFLYGAGNFSKIWSAGAQHTE